MAIHTPQPESGEERSPISQVCALVPRNDRVVPC